MDYFVQNLKLIMLRQGYSRSSLARALGIHTTTVTNWIDNGKRPQPTMLLRLADLLGYEPESLFQETPVKVGAEAEAAQKTSGANGQRQETWHGIVMGEDELEEDDGVFDAVIYRNPSDADRILFSVMRGATDEDKIRAAKIIEALRNESTDSGY